MKIVKRLTNEEVQKELPPPVVAALHALDTAEYCHVCDGLRLKGHKCVPEFVGGPEGPSSNDPALN